MINELQKLVKSRGWTNTALATKLGVSTAAVSTYLHGKYAGNLKQFEAKVSALLDLERSRAKDKKLAIPFVETKGASRIFQLIAMAHSDEEVAILYGDAGLGKTKAVKEYTENHKGTILIETDPSYSPRVLLTAIARELGLTPRRAINDLMEALVSGLKDSGRLLIIDEAELLSYRSLELIRRLHDKAGIPVVLCGMPRLLQNLRGTKGEYRQLYSRIAYQLSLGEKAHEEDIHTLAKGALGELGESELSAILKASQRNIRHAIKLFRAVERVARLNNAPISEKLIKRAAEFLVV